jgi:hypothetical protein
LQEAPAAVGQLMVEEAAAASACRLIGRVWLLPVYLPLCGCCLLTTCVPCCVAAGCWATTTHVCLWCGACWCLEVCGRVRFCYLYFCCGNIWCGGGLQQPTPVIGTGRACVWKCVVVCVFVICTSAVVIYGGGGGLGQPTPVFGTGRAGVSTFVVVCAINTSAVVIWGGVVGCKIARFLICE